MSGEDLMLSIKCAIFEEQKKAYYNREIFDRTKITIMATAKVICMITATLEPYVNWYSDGQTKCFGCNLKMIGGDGVHIYLAKDIPILSNRIELNEAGAEDV